MLTIIARIRPNSPMVRNDPTGERSRCVVYPYRLSAPNDAADMKKVRVIDAPVYARNTDDSMSPSNAA
jgi:hypothetical protein